MALIVTAMLVVAPAAKVPLVAERSLQLVLLLAVQFKLALPLLVSMYTWLEGLNGPPACPLKIRSVNGVTASAPARLPQQA